MDWRLGVLLVISGQIATTLSVRGPIVACPLLYAPVCGSDGEVYDNECLLQARAQDSDKQITVVPYNQCKNAPRLPCFCVDAYIPVCGTDGNTYNNACTLQCEARYQSSLSMAYAGPCRSPDSGVIGY